jgi:putative transposase
VYVNSRFGLSKRRACKLVNLHRSTCYYHALTNDDAGLRTRMRELATTHKRFGSPRIHTLLKREGLVINHKRTERIYRNEGLSLRRRTKKKRVLPVRVQMPPASKPNEVWSMDFMSDACSRGRRLKILTLVDDFSKVSPGIMADTSIPSRKVTAYLDQIALFYGYPERIRVDNGPEFTSAIFHQWAEARHIVIEHTRPGKPSDNAFIESFNGKLRDECLNEHWFINVSDAQEKIGTWRDTYNRERPHSSLNDLSPYEFMKEHYITLQEQGLNFDMAHTLG